MVQAQAYENGDPITLDYIFGTRRETFFSNPRRKRAIVIGCSEYENLRRITGKDYCDI